jgi:hypothetical protein
MKTQMLTVLTIISAGIIAGCGSSNTSPSTTSAVPSTTSISGKVADGYLVGATVFLDKNNNYQLDSGEPQAASDQNGAYTLTVDPADVGKYPIVAIATKGVTIDKDTGTTVTGSYILSLPATAISGTVSSNFISPMSSLLREMMETGKYDSIQQAMSELGTKLGMPMGTNMLGDYVASNDSSMHGAARNMAGLMGSQMGQVLGANGSNTTVDVDRYRGMMGSIFSNMSTVRGAGSNAQTGMSNLMNTMTTVLSNMPMTSAGQPFRNMSAAFRGRMMGGPGASSSAGSATWSPGTMPVTGMGQPFHNFSTVFSGGMMGGTAGGMMR